MNNKIDMLQGIKNANILKSISGRDLGERQRKLFELDLEDKSKDLIEVNIGSNILFVSSSFFLGMFGDSVRKFGSKEEFYKKYKFIGKTIAKDSIDEAIYEALKKNGALG